MSSQILFNHSQDSVHIISIRTELYMRTDSAVMLIPNNVNAKMYSIRKNKYRIAHIVIHLGRTFKAYI